MHKQAKASKPMPPPAAPRIRHSAPSRACVVTSSDFKSCIAPLKNVLSANKIEYAARHKYELRWVPMLAARADNCSFQFNKIDAMVRAIDDGCAHVLWLDIDLLVTEMRFDFTAWLAAGNASSLAATTGDAEFDGFDAVFQAAPHPFGGGHASASRQEQLSQLNSGVWAVRSNARSRAALTSLDLPRFCNINQPEQNALIHRIAQADQGKLSSWRVRMLSDERGAAADGLPLAQAECGSSRPSKDGSLECAWRPGDFCAHFYPTACPLHDATAFLRAQASRVDWPQTRAALRAQTAARRTGAGARR